MEDEPYLAEAVCDGLRLEAIAADIAGDGNTALELLGLPSFMAYSMPVHIVDGQWVWSRGGGNPGVGANWTVYPYTGWVGVILSNIDGVPLQEMAEQETQAVMGRH